MDSPRREPPGGLDYRIALRAVGRFGSAEGRALQPLKKIDVVQPLHYTVLMPTLKRFANCRIEVRSRDHMPPHFHVVMSDGRSCVVEIDSLEVVGEVKVLEIADAIKWAGNNKEKLIQEWRKWRQ